MTTMDDLDDADAEAGGDDCVCGHCGHPPHEACAARHKPSGYVCTKRAGHEGLHVACGGERHDLVGPWATPGDDG